LSSKEKSGQANRASSTSGETNSKDVKSHLPERIILQRKPSLSGLEMTAIGNLEGLVEETKNVIQPPPKGALSTSTGDLSALVTQLQSSDATKPLKEAKSSHLSIEACDESQWLKVRPSYTCARNHDSFVLWVVLKTRI